MTTLNTKELTEAEMEEGRVQLKRQTEFDIETNQLINQICDTFHDELKKLADKYGIIYLSIKQVDPDCLVSDRDILRSDI